MQIFEGFEGHGKPIYAWTDGVEFESAARWQVSKTALLPIIFDHVAVMPDVHFGIGATVGSVIATKAAIIPAAVGVDIGCGMCWQRTSLRVDDLPDLASLRHDIERTVPVGFNWHKRVPASVETAWNAYLCRMAGVLALAHPKITRDWRKAVDQLATLGGGNHFIELCVDEEGFVSIMLHSGSRGIGNQIGRYFIEKAKLYAAARKIELPDRDLAWFDEGTGEFYEYYTAMSWAQAYAATNRDLMMSRILDSLRRRSDLPSFTLTEQAVNCHHNYTALENHYGEDVYITRKGAVRAGAGELGIIPGSMGAKSFIVVGKGKPESFESCSHGAGRRMGRGQARRSLTVEDLAMQTKGVECRKDEGVLDEAPAAYKDIDAVMSAQSDLVHVKHTLKQLVCVKG
ncbi:MAG: RtcB family protein [Patescibacteria group bacterium]|nr:RtcB family protein [Patescibacteria group bacterium]